MRHVRTREPFRKQAVMQFTVPDDALPEDHRARLLWRVVETLDLYGFTSSAKAVEGHVGRSLTSVRMQLTLWLYAISVGIGSAREIERCTRSDAAFQWIVGDQKVSHDTLSTFRVGHGAALDKTFTDVLGVLSKRHCTSRRCSPRPTTSRHVEAPITTRWAEKAARLAAAHDYQQRVEEALVVVKELAAEGKEKPRASTTDARAHARVMKMPDGGYRPGYNIQMATAGSTLGGPRTIVGVRVNNVGSDMGSIVPMLDQIQSRTGELPKVLLADANHAKHDCIRECAQRGVVALIPVPARSQKAGPNADNDEAITAWRARMQTDEAKRTFRARASLCELSNAHLKQHHGVAQILVRGVEKATCVALLAALAANLLQHATALLA